MTAYAKKNKILQEWDVSFKVIKHEKPRGGGGLSMQNFLGHWEVQLLKYHKDEKTHCLSTYGNTITEAWQAMLFAMNRQENHLLNTLNLQDEPYDN